MQQSLAVKYRPKTFEDVVEQDAIKIILQNQLETNTFKQSYLFCGPSGDGKTTLARIFANEINKGQGSPIEIDAASNNGVDNIRELSQEAKTQAIDCEYKTFICDEAHNFTNNAWEAMLKLIEEPPAKTIFIFCTTNPEKIPKTILSRVQRYNFRRISTKGISDRLKNILYREYYADIELVTDDMAPNGFFESEAIDFIAKQAAGGMRDAITMLDKVMSYDKDINMQNTLIALGIVDYDSMFDLFEHIKDNKQDKVILDIETVYGSGMDLKQYIKSFTDFILDICKYGFTGDLDLLKIPVTYEMTLKEYIEYDFGVAEKLLLALIRLNTDIKWDVNPKATIEANLLLYMTGVE